MKNIFLFLILGFFALQAEERDSSYDLDKEIKKISEAMGHLIGRNLDTLGLKFDVNLVIKGIKDASSGKEPPMTEDECVQAISIMQENALSEIAEKNLEEANHFLQKNLEEENIIALEKGKLQYKVDKEGSGHQVQAYNSPVIRYKGTYLDGSVFGVSEDSELISLDETIPGFSKGIVGMKEGEVRTIYIHPDLGYGKSGLLAPNSLLTFEIEIIKADGSQEMTVQSETQPELAKPEGTIR